MPENDPKQEFLALLAPIRDQLYRFARRTMIRKDDAEDALQDAVLSAYAAFGKFELGTQFRPWLYRFLVNKVMNANQKAKRSGEAPGGDAVLDAAGAAPAPETWASVLSNPERFLEAVGDDLHEGLRSLSDAERACLLLRAAEDFSYREIAGFLGIPAGTVMSHIFRGREKVRRFLAGRPRPLK